ncbi:MAG: hypothetical protein ABIJ09_23780 [Pseudomonadota bacterium]
MICRLALVLAALVLGSLSQAQGASPGQLTLIADPPTLLLGQTPEVPIRIEGPVAVEPASVRLFASTGSLSEATVGGSGSLVTLYKPPEAFFPQVAILAAVADTSQGVLVGWVALPLVGQGELSVPGQPGSEVSISIGERSFGPVAADASGQASIRVEVPPGFSEGQSGSTKIPIPMVPFSQVLLVPLAPSLAVVDDTSLELRVFVVTARGAPADKATLKFKAKYGTAGGVERMGPGVYSVRFKPKPRSAGKTAKVTVSMAGHKPSSSTVEFALRDATRPARLELVTVPPAASPGAQVTVVVRVLDEAGQAAPGVPVLTTDRGELGGLQEVAPGQFQGQLTLPDWAGEVALSAQLPVEGGAALTAEHALTVQAAEPAVAVGADDDTRELASAGVATEVSTGQAPLGLTLGVSAAFESNFVALFAPGLALDVTMLGRGVLDGLALRLELGGLYQYGQTEFASGPLVGRTFTRQLFTTPLSLQADYRLRVADSLAIFAGLGGSLGYLLSVLDESTRHSLTLGALVQAGVAWHVGPGELVLKLRYLYGGLEQPWGGASILGGYAIPLL